MCVIFVPVVRMHVDRFLVLVLKFREVGRRVLCVICRVLNRSSDLLEIFVLEDSVCMKKWLKNNEWGYILCRPNDAEDGYVKYSNGTRENERKRGRSSGRWMEEIKKMCGVN